MSGGTSCIVEQFGIGDDALVPGQVVRVDLADDERDLGVHPPGRRVVDDGGAALGRFGGEAPGGIAAGAEERDVDAVERLGVASPTTCSVPSTLTLVPALRALASRRSSPNGKPRSRSIRIIVPPTTPVAPTTATVRGLVVTEGMAPRWCRSRRARPRV